MRNQWENVTSRHSLCYNTTQKSLKMMLRDIQQDDFGDYRLGCVCVSKRESNNSTIRDCAAGEAHFLCKESEYTCNSTSDMSEEGIYWRGCQKADVYRVSRQKIHIQISTTDTHRSDSLSVALPVCVVVVVLLLGIGIAVFYIIKKYNYCKRTSPDNAEDCFYDNFQEPSQTPDSGIAIKTIYDTAAFPTGESDEFDYRQVYNTPTDAVYFTVNHPASEQATTSDGNPLKTEKMSQHINMNIHLLLVLSLSTGSALGSLWVGCKGGWISMTCKDLNNDSLPLHRTKITPNEAQGFTVVVENLQPDDYIPVCRKRGQTIQIVNCSQSSTHHTAYKNAPTTVECGYPDYSRPNTFLCKETSDFNCEDITTINKRVNYSKTTNSFSITITEVSPEDQGTYWCVARGHYFNSTYKRVFLTVRSGFSDEKRSFVLGQDFQYMFNYEVRYPKSLFFCKGEDPLVCQYLMAEGLSTNPDKYAQTNDKDEKKICITIYNTTEEDAGIYWFGAETHKEYGRKIFSRLELTLSSALESSWVGCKGGWINMTCKDLNSLPLQRTKITPNEAQGFTVVVENLKPDDNIPVCGKRGQTIQIVNCSQLSIQHTAYENTQATVECGYPHLKNIFLCKETSDFNCEDITAINKRAYNFRTTNSFSITITEVSPEDQGTYWCVASGHYFNRAYKRVFISVRSVYQHTKSSQENNVQHMRHTCIRFPYVTIALSVSVALVVLLVLVVVIWVLKCEYCKSRKDPSEQNRKEPENVYEEIRDAVTTVYATAEAAKDSIQYATLDFGQDPSSTQPKAHVSNYSAVFSKKSDKCTISSAASQDLLYSNLWQH
ncbi:hypothetical protein WMY93_011504 [Mugilogobius chulae]|uniref:Immunoglobulin domain-containing protein n=1 Tax=Mugilogobius chulae TaxID=88201 RepID=A0AAW0PEU1_9GOBI